MESNSGETSDLYGVLTSRNIDKVWLGPYETNTWYGNAAYFAPNSKTLGINATNDSVHSRSKKVIPNKKTDHSKKTDHDKKTHTIEQSNGNFKVNPKKLCIRDITVNPDDNDLKVSTNNRLQMPNTTFNSKKLVRDLSECTAKSNLQLRVTGEKECRNYDVKENLSDEETGGYDIPNDGESNGEIIMEPHENGTKNGIGENNIKKLHDNDSSDIWIDTLYVCDYCFKYTDIQHELFSHRALCPHNRAVPHIGTLKYVDRQSGYLIVQIKGYQHELFVENLCLFGKLFLDNKSVYYNVHLYDVYVVYGKDQINGEPDNFKPMGFFSKEINAWDNDNNLACICVFPPYQRRKLGYLLIEFLYELAAVTPGQQISGPEFPLSKFGQLSYLKFWSRKLASTLQELVQQRCKQFKLLDLSKLTGFRKEDILMTLEYMKVLVAKDEQVIFQIVSLERWCEQNLKKNGSLLRQEYLLL